MLLSLRGDRGTPNTLFHSMRKDVRETDAFTLCPVVKAPYTTSDGGTVRSTLDDATTLSEALGKSGVTNLFTDTAVFSAADADGRYTLLNSPVLEDPLLPVESTTTKEADAQVDSIVVKLSNDAAVARKQFVALTLAVKGDSVVDGGTVGTTSIRFVGDDTTYTGGAWSISGGTTALSSSKIVGVDFEAVSSFTRRSPNVSSSCNCRL